MRHLAAVLLLASSALSFAEPTTPVTPERLEKLYLAAAAMSKLPLAPHPPEFKLLSSPELQELICKRACPSIHGAQRENIVYVDKDLDFADPFNATIIIHELVHYLQWAQLGPAMNCEDWETREDEAYRIQAYAVEQFGSKRKLMPHNRGACT